MNTRKNVGRVLVSVGRVLHDTLEAPHERANYVPVLFMQPLGKLALAIGVRLGGIPGTGGEFIDIEPECSIEECTSSVSGNSPLVSPQQIVHSMLRATLGESYPSASDEAAFLSTAAIPETPPQEQ
jgi:hypothetical protein